MSTIFRNQSRGSMCHSAEGRGSDRPARWALDRDRLVVAGEVDQSSRATVKAGLIEALHSRDVSVIDLTGVTFFSAAGVSLLLELGLQERFTVLGNEVIRRVLDICELSHLLSHAPPVV